MHLKSLQESCAFPVVRLTILVWSPSTVREDLLYLKLRIFYENINYLGTLKIFISLLACRTQTSIKKIDCCTPVFWITSVTSLEALFYPAWCMLQTAIPGLSAIYTWKKIFKIASSANSAQYQTKNTIFKKWMS